MKILSRSLILGVGLALLAASVAAVPPSYVGAKKCRVCHIKQFQSWEKTRMAHAFELLRPGAAAAAKKKANLEPQKDYCQLHPENPPMFQVKFPPLCR